MWNLKKKKFREKILEKLHKEGFNAFYMGEDIPEIIAWQPFRNSTGNLIKISGVKTNSKKQFKDFVCFAVIGIILKKDNKENLLVSKELLEKGVLTSIIFAEEKNGQILFKEFGPVGGKDGRVINPKYVG